MKGPHTEQKYVNGKSQLQDAQKRWTKPRRAMAGPNTKMKHARKS